MRIAIFGGSFNPPHLSHQLACTVVLATARPRVDEVWMVPTWKHPFDKPLAPYADRVAMCERAAAPFGGRVAVSRLEEELGGDSFTLRLVRELMARRPSDQLSLVIGADLLAERERWHGWQELRELVPFIVVGREGAPAGEARSGVDLPPISSTELRRRLHEGDLVDGLLDDEVLEYIRQRGLYGRTA
jgi:nicotinate-nucleotide adenylyltransferase